MNRKLLEALVEDSRDIVRSLEEAALRNPGNSEWIKRLEEARGILAGRLKELECEE